MSARREQVLEAATALLVEAGTYGLTHRKVDARAGVPVGTTSNYFPNRVSLARSVLDRIVAADAAYLAQEDVEGDAATDPEEMLLSWTRRRMAFLLGPGRLFVLTWYRFAVDGSSDAEVREALGNLRAAVFTDCQAVLVRCGSPDPATQAKRLLSFIGGLVIEQHVTPIPDFDPDRVLAPMVRGMVQMMRQPGGVSHGAP